MNESEPTDGASKNEDAVRIAGRSVPAGNHEEEYRGTCQRRSRRRSVEASVMEVEQSGDVVQAALHSTWQLSVDTGSSEEGICAVPAVVTKVRVR